MTTVYIESNTNSCEVNSLYAERLFSYFLANHITVAERRSEADVVVLLGCGFDRANDEQFGALVAHSKAGLLPNQRLLVCGCWPGMHPESEVLHGVETIPLWEDERFDHYFEASVPFCLIKSNRLSNRSLDSYSDLFAPGEQGDFFIHTSRGCVNTCSYCFIKRAKGSLKSEPPDQIEAQYLQGRKEGVKRFVLVSDDFGSYGQDIGTKGTELIERLLKADPEGQFVVNYLYPGAFLEDFDAYKRLSQSGSLISVNIPVQSFSQRILDLMNRRYSIRELKLRLRELRQAAPGVRLVTHVIIGFPSSTEEDFYLTLVHAVTLFDHVAVFPYGDRQGTASQGMGPKISADVMKSRETSVRLLGTFLPEGRITFKDGAAKSGLRFGAPEDQPIRREVLSNVEDRIPVNVPDGGLSFSSHTGTEGSSAESGVLDEKVIAMRRFLFVLVSIELTLTRVLADPTCSLGGLVPLPTEPANSRDAGQGVKVKFAGPAGALELCVYEGEREADCFLRTRHFSVDYPKGTLMEDEKVRGLLLVLLKRVAAYVDTALG